jgi:hypothetical protein
MKKITLSIAALIAATSLNSHANNLAIDIGNDAVNLEIASTNLAQNSEFSFAMLYGDNDVHLYSFKGLVTGQLEQNTNLTAALGGKIYLLDYRDENIQGLALGGELHYQLPMNKKIEFDGSIYYAPSPTLTDDLDYLTDLTLTASYNLLKNGAIYVNYRTIKANHESGADFRIDNGFNIGLKFSF